MSSLTPKPKFLLDENVRADLAKFLQSQGLDVKQTPKTSTDSHLASLSKREKRILVTNKDGLIADDELALFFDKDDLYEVTIERLGKKATDTPIIEEESFHIKAKNNKGDLVSFDIDVSSIQLLKDIPPASTEAVKLENGSNGYRMHTTPIHLESKESFGKIVKPSKSKAFDGQVRVKTNSRVTGPDGEVRAGAAEFTLPAVDNKLVIVVEKISR